MFFGVYLHSVSDSQGLQLFTVSGNSQDHGWSTLCAMS